MEEESQQIVILDNYQQQKKQKSSNKIIIYLGYVLEYLEYSKKLDVLKVFIVDEKGRKLGYFHNTKYFNPEIELNQIIEDKIMTGQLYDLSLSKDKNLLGKELKVLIRRALLEKKDNGEYFSSAYKDLAIYIVNLMNTRMPNEMPKKFLSYLENLYKIIKYEPCGSSGDPLSKKHEGLSHKEVVDIAKILLSIKDGKNMIDTDVSLQSEIDIQKKTIRLTRDNIYDIKLAAKSSICGIQSAAEGSIYFVFSAMSLAFYDFTRRLNLECANNQLRDEIANINKHKTFLEGKYETFLEGKYETFLEKKHKTVLEFKTKEGQKNLEQIELRRIRKNYHNEVIDGIEKNAKDVIQISVHKIKNMKLFDIKILDEIESFVFKYFSDAAEKTNEFIKRILPKESDYDYREYAMNSISKGYEIEQHCEKQYETNRDEILQNRYGEEMEEETIAELDSKLISELDSGVINQIEEKITLVMQAAFDDIKYLALNDLDRAIGDMQIKKYYSDKISNLEELEDKFTKAHERKEKYLKRWLKNILDEEIVKSLDNYRDYEEGLESSQSVDNAPDSYLKNNMTGQDMQNDEGQINSFAKI
jgi:hypothetical protein